MKFLKTITLVFLAFAGLVQVARAQREEIQFGRRLASPDGRFTAKYIEGGDDSGAGNSIIITDNRTGKVYPAQPSILAVLYIKWGNDSRTLLTLNHIAGGNVACVEHLKKGKWVYYDTVPKYPGLDVAAYEVTRLAQKGHTLELAYAMTNKAIPNKCWVYSFTIDCDTGERSHEKTKAIDIKTYGNLRFTEK